MIGRLRGKFIGAAMLAMFIVLAVIVAAINVWNYASICREADEILQVLADNGGYFPKGKFPDNRKEPGESGGERPDRDKDNQGDAGEWMGDGEPGRVMGGILSPELPYESRYFTVVFQNETLISINTGNVAAVDSDLAAEYGEYVLESGKEKGFLGTYRYHMAFMDGEEVNQGTDGKKLMVIFLDCRKSFSTFRDFGVASAAVAAVGLVSVFLLIIAFSKAVFQPVRESAEKQKQFITDAGHELKTPLAIISANAEVLEMEQGDSEWLKSIRNQVDRLSVLTGELIQLSRMEEAGAQMEKREFRLSEVMEEVVDSFLAPGKARGIHITEEIQQNVIYQGDEKSIRQLLDILMENAVKYCQEDGDIKVSLGRAGKNTVLGVYNTAAGPLPENMEQMFERFYRGDGARNSGNGGYGIGLAIAKAIVQGHKGKIRASSVDGKSVWFHVTL